MNIFGFFLFLRFHTYYKSADDIKNIRNKLLSVQVTLLMFSSILEKSSIFGWNLNLGVQQNWKARAWTLNLELVIPMEPNTEMVDSF